MSRLLRSRFGLVYAWIAQTLIVFFVLRVALLATVWSSVPHQPLPLLHLFLIGLRMDLAVSFGTALPILLIVTFMPMRWFEKERVRFVVIGLYISALYLFVFLNIANYFFFEEFNSQFNYIAIDYLFLSPREVVENIWQSYPVPALLILTGAMVWGLSHLTRTLVREEAPIEVPTVHKVVAFFSSCVLAFLFLISVDIRMLGEGSNRILAEVSGNGLYTLGYALFTNHMSYDEYYPTVDSKIAFLRVQKQVFRKDAASTSLINPLERSIPSRRGLGNKNVVIILEESLGSSFVGKLRNDPPHLTPNLDALSERGLFFRRIYSTGTRTIRALEAVLCSFPPIPGASIVKRSDSHHVATLARTLRGRGYENIFIYGGRGVFDNMRSFMLDNGFDRFIEQKDYADPTFTTAWGVADEDIFRKAIETFDALPASRPFFATILTVSNHKPYSYPAGRIDLDPNARSRHHAVKYADWALGKFFKEARSHRFFKNTVFVVLGDHGARVYGADFIPIASYEIPLLIYAPGLIEPRVIDTVGSSMDVAPTILGLLGQGYESTFFGRDLLDSEPPRDYVLLQHDRDVGLLRADHLAVLGTRKTTNLYDHDPAVHRFSAVTQRRSGDEELIQDAISFYQLAYELYSKGRYCVAGQEK